jgi:hypothetical protein
VLVECTEEGLAGSQQGAAYYSGIDTAFGGALVNLLAEPPHSWKTSADLPGSVVLRLQAHRQISTTIDLLGCL